MRIFLIKCRYALINEGQDWFDEEPPFLSELKDSSLFQLSM
jgi:hypothetical protein